MDFCVLIIHTNLIPYSSAQLTPRFPNLPSRPPESMSAAADKPVINCLMLVTWPQRRQMTQEALVSFIRQDYTNRVLTIVDDGSPCRLCQGEFSKRRERGPWTGGGGGG